MPTISLVAVSMISTVSSSLAQSKTNLPSWVMVMPRGRWPDLIVLTTSILSIRRR